MKVSDIKFNIEKVLDDNKAQNITAIDLKNKSLEELTKLFGKSGNFYYNIVRGVHNSPVKPNRIRKSIAAERTFSKNISSEVFMLERLDKIAEELEKRMMILKTKGKTITLKIKYSDFTQQTRSKTGNLYLSNKDLILERVKELLYKEKLSNSVRLIGISISNLNAVKKENKVKPLIKISQLSLPF